MSGRNPVKGAPLTDRERECVDALLDDCADKVIADRLGLAVKTVRRHLESARKKAGVATRTGLAVWAVRNPRPAEQKSIERRDGVVRHMVVG